MDVHIKSQSPQQYGVAAVSIAGEKILVNGQIIGVTIEHYNQAVDTIEEYYDMLVDAEIIIPELTQEEKIENLSIQLAESAAQLAESKELNKRFAAMLEKLEQTGETHEKNTTLLKEENGKISSPVRKSRNIKSDRISPASDGVDD